MANAIINILECNNSRIRLVVTQGDNPLSRVTIFTNGVERGFWTAPPLNNEKSYNWQPSHFNDGLNVIRVNARDNQGNVVSEFRYIIKGLDEDSTLSEIITENEKIKNDINELISSFKGYLLTRGVSATDSDTLSELVTKFNNEIIDRGGARTIIPTTSNQILSKGLYKGDITVAGDSYLISKNIKKGINLFGVAGTLDDSPKTKGGNVFTQSASGEGTVSSYKALAIININWRGSVYLDATFHLAYGAYYAYVYKVRGDQKTLLFSSGLVASNSRYTLTNEVVGDLMPGDYLEFGAHGYDSVDTSEGPVSGKIKYTFY